MSWDIYGNSLRRGHCEVHPHVHEPYPCFVCVNDAQRAEKYRLQEQSYIEAHYQECCEGEYIENLQGMHGDGI